MSRYLSAFPDGLSVGPEPTDCSTAAAGPTTRSFLGLGLECSVDNRYREFEQLLPGLDGHGLVDDKRYCGRSFPNFLDAMDIQPPRGVAAFEPLQHFSGFVDLSGFVIEHAQRAIAARPLRQEIDRLLELLAPLRGLALENREQALSTEKFARPWITGEAFLQGFFRIGKVVLPNGVLENFGGLAGLSKMGFDIAEQSEESVVLASVG